MRRGTHHPQHSQGHSSDAKQIATMDYGESIRNYWLVIISSVQTFL